MVSFSDKWHALKNNEKLSQAFMGRVKPDAPLKNRLDTAQKKLQLQITKLAEIDTKLQQKIKMEKQFLNIFTEIRKNMPFHFK